MIRYREFEGVGRLEHVECGQLLPRRARAHVYPPEDGNIKVSHDYYCRTCFVWEHLVIQVPQDGGA